MTDEQILQVIADTLQVDVSSLKNDVDYRATSWDSLADLIFIGKVDDEFSKSISTEALADCRYVPDFVELVKNA